MTLEFERYDDWTREQCFQPADYDAGSFFADLSSNGHKASDKHKSHERDARAATEGTVIKLVIQPRWLELGRVADDSREPSAGVEISPNFIRGPPRGAVIRSV